MPGQSPAFDTYKTRVVLVGACAVDTILTVPYFPNEDSKLRAVSSIKRRGGNCPNTLEVLHQLVQFEELLAVPSENREDVAAHSAHIIDSLYLMATLPSRASPIMPFIYNSFSIPGKETKVDFSHCIHREDHADPVSSYIISSQASGSRTIVNHNDLPEMTSQEFERTIDSSQLTQEDPRGISTLFHFEGRIPDVTLTCMKRLRRIWRERIDNLIISVELEKPGREGLQDLADQADVVFFSRSWAEGEGYTSATDCLVQQARRLKDNNYFGQQTTRTLVCTWDKSGACALTISNSADPDISSVVHGPASVIAEADIVDSVGAGDTFIAGMLFALINRKTQWSLKQQLDFANALAGRKIVQQGFSRLAAQFMNKV